MNKQIKILFLNNQYKAIQKQLKYKSNNNLNKKSKIF